MLDAINRINSTIFYLLICAAIIRLSLPHFFFHLPPTVHISVRRPAGETKYRLNQPKFACLYLTGLMVL